MILPSAESQYAGCFGAPGWGYGPGYMGYGYGGYGYSNYRYGGYGFGTGVPFNYGPAYPPYRGCYGGAPYGYPYGK
ncbi:unnamed protein product [Toxocara canis]|nr:unnamed protein product [Toxocara canis]